MPEVFDASESAARGLRRYGRSDATTPPARDRGQGIAAKANRNPVIQPGMVASWQGQVGNAAISRMLAVQRSEMFMHDANVLSPEGQPNLAKDIPWAQIEKSANDELVRLAGSTIARAAVDFKFPINNVRVSKAAAAKAQVEWATLMVEIVAGYLAPGLGAAAASIAKSEAEKVGRSAFAATGIMTGADADWDKLIKAADTRLFAADVAKVFGSDNVKNTFLGAVKSAGQAAKTRASALAGETNIDVLLKQLHIYVSDYEQQLTRGLRSMTGAELLAIISMYDVTVANLTTYEGVVKELVEKYESEVDLAPSVGTPGGSAALSSKHIRIDVWGRPRLAVASIVANTFGETYSFERYVSPEMEPIVHAKGGIIDLDPKKIRNHIPAPSAVRTEVVRMDAYGRFRRALVQITEGKDVDRSKATTFVRWINRDMEAFEDKKAGGMRTISPTEIWGKIPTPVDG